jgi:hypothetical protein
MPCTETVELKRTDGGVSQWININVQRGSCSVDQEPCAEGFILNTDFTSSVACSCDLLQLPIGTLIDTGADPHPGYKFGFEKLAAFTLREWPNAAGEYDWSLPDWTLPSSDVFQCFKHIHTKYDSRYRQVSFEAETPNCVDTIVRTSMADNSITEHWQFKVWPESPPTFEDGAVWFPIDATPLPEVVVQAGSTFYIVLNERPYSPNGFAW